MRTPPATPTDLDVLSAIRAEWKLPVHTATYLPVGFGAHHWRLDIDGKAALFATLDLAAGYRTAEMFESAYAAAAGLAADGFGWVVPPTPSVNGRFTFALAGGLLSVCSWVDGRTPDESEALAHVGETAQILRELHDVAVTDAMPRWSPRVRPGLPRRLEALLAQPWTSGPFGEAARADIQRAYAVIEQRARRYAELTALAAECRWVPTHGEPHCANQLRTPTGLRLVDWESFAVAPPERDVLDLPESERVALGADPAMVELFELEWRLSEIEEFAEWFCAPHSGSEDDRIALGGLRDELDGWS